MNSYGDFPSSQRGGGFPQSQGDFTSPGNNQPGQKRNDQQRWILPVTIKQIVTSESLGGKFEISGREVGQVKLIGLVLSIEQKAQYFTFAISDGTGIIPVRIFVELDEEMMNEEQGGAGGNSNKNRNSLSRAALLQIPEGVYVRVFGVIRTQQESSKYISSYHISLVHDHNEVTFHLLDSIASHCYQKFGPPQANKAHSNNTTYNNDNKMSIEKSENMGNSGSIDINNNSLSLTGIDISGFTDIQKKVLVAFEAPSNEAGISIHDVCSSLSLSLAQVKSAVDFLTDEGHLYSTIDDDHYKSTAQSN